MWNFATNRRGQTAVEFVLMVPFFAAVAAMVMFVTYTCWQGVKTQQAANLAARIAGQQAVGGAQNFGQIDTMNGVQAGVTNNNNPNPGPPTPTPGGSVYSDYYTKVQRLMKISDSTKLRAFPPSIGLQSVEVKVIRTISLPAIFFLGAQQISIGDDRHMIGSLHYVSAYGGEDTYMYGLPRWGAPGLGSSSYWRGLMTKVKAVVNPNSTAYN
jgi:hypothetical protein